MLKPKDRVPLFIARLPLLLAVVTTTSLRPLPAQDRSAGDIDRRLTAETVSGLVLLVEQEYNVMLPFGM